MSLTLFLCLCHYFQINRKFQFCLVLFFQFYDLYLQDLLQKNRFRTFLERSQSKFP